MKPSHGRSLHTSWIAIAVLAAAVLAGCSDDGHTDSSTPRAAEAVKIDGSDLKQVVLTERAAQRLDIKMAAIGMQGSDLVAPYASVVYDKAGNTWVYTSPKPLTYVRTPITVTSIAGEQAILSGGPGAGTNVVTVGTAELFGVENGIGQTSGSGH